MEELLANFKEYCKTPGTDSGKAQSYANAIQYLCDFLGVESINECVVDKFRAIEKHITWSNDETRRQLLAFLEKRHQKSYLCGGFIQAALKYFYPFWETYRAIK